MRFGFDPSTDRITDNLDIISPPISIDPQPYHGEEDGTMAEMVCSIGEPIPCGSFEVMSEEWHFTNPEFEALAHL